MRTILVVCVTAVVAAAGCSNSGDSVSDASMSPEAARGLQIAKDQGCTACHSPDGRSGVGPTWQGLYGSTVTLDDDSEVTADDEYLARAIDDPGADIVEGYSGIMPDKDLDEAQVSEVIAYIKTLTS